MSGFKSNEIALSKNEYKFLQGLVFLTLDESVNVCFNRGNVYFFLWDFLVLFKLLNEGFYSRDKDIKSS